MFTDEDRHIPERIELISSMSVLQRLPLSRKILLGILPLFLLFISLSVVLQNHFQEQEMMEEAQRSAGTYADIIKNSLVSMMVNNLEVDSTFLKRVNAIPQFDTLRVIVNQLRLRQEVLTPERAARVEMQARTSGPRDPVEATVLAEGIPRFVRNGDIFRAVIPFAADSVCQRCHAVPVGYALGATDLQISFARIAQAAQSNWKRSMTIFVIFTGLVIAVASVMFTRFVSRPVDRLVAATQEIRKGNLSVLIPGNHAGPDQHDELLFLASRFDDMRRSLKEKIDQLDHANRALSERNREVEEALAQLRRAQEELIRTERLAAMGTLTAQLSHEINNPIHNIQSLLESSLRKLPPGEQTHELAKVALEEVSRVSRLTRQLLDLYRGSVTEIQREPLDIRALLGEVAQAFVEPLARQDITVAVDCPEDIPRILGSRDKLKQVLINLIINARDAQPTGGKVLLACVATKDEVQIRVEDRGIGIPPEHLNRIFDAFFTTKKEVSGVGLGLSVCHGIIHQHRGYISVESVVGTGTAFTVHLPLKEFHNG